MKVVFAGTPAFAAAHLTALIEAGIEILAVITQPDRPGKRGKKLQPSPVKTVATAAGLTVLQPEKLRIGDVAEIPADLLIVVAYGQILRKRVLDWPDYGCINVHASLLPRWRGAAPIQRAILAGDTETGVCIMQMDEGLDTGDVMLERRVDISDHDTTETLTDKLAEAGTSALIEALPAITSGTMTRSVQPEAGVTYAHKIEKAETLIDWQASATFISRQVRAFNPDPVAHATLSDMRVRIWAATPVDEPASGEPGEILSVSKKGVMVACGAGTLLIRRLQLPIGKGSVLSGADILNARTDVVYPGLRFGA